MGFVWGTALLAGSAAAQSGASIEEVLVIGVRDTHTVRTDDTMVAPADTAELLRKMPGPNINSNGELTGIAQYRGMHGDRVNVMINGAHISSGGPHAMDAPLHYAPVAALESLTIRRGITPVSAGQETIGGHVDAVTYSGDFGFWNDFEWSGLTYLGGQSINDGIVGSAFLTYANRSHIFRTLLMTEQARDSRFPDGTIEPTEYRRDRIDVGYSRRDIDDNLYRVAPDNLVLALDYIDQDWLGTLETVTYAGIGAQPLRAPDLAVMRMPPADQQAGGQCLKYSNARELICSERASLTRRGWLAPACDTRNAN